MSTFADLPTSRISSSEATKTLPNVKTVLISVTKEDGGIEYAIAPLKTSYPEAVSTAFEALKTHLGNLTPDDISLKMAAKNISGDVVWASVSQSVWMEMVSEGAELRIFSNSIPAVPTQVAGPSARMDKEPGPLITLVLPESVAKYGKLVFITLIAPKSYDEVRILAFNLLKDDFKQDKSSWQDVVLRGFVEEGKQKDSLSFQTRLSAYGMGESPEWMQLITQLKKEYPDFKILIF